MNKDICVKPFLRWAGGKRWLLPILSQIVKIDEYKNYYEPFLGGGSVFFELNPQGRSFLSDSNSDLVNAYSCIKVNPNEVWDVLKTYKNESEDYYFIRAQDPIDDISRAARFIYLNQTSFNGLYRVNKEGKYNVPYGKRGNVNFNLENILAVSKRLEKAELFADDFEQALESVSAGDLVYLDPPYVVAKDNNCFIQYNKKLFDLDDQRRLSQCIDRIKSVGAFYILSNAKHDAICEIFKKEKDSAVILKRSSFIGGKNAFRGKTEEYLFTNIPYVTEKLHQFINHE